MPIGTLGTPSRTLVSRKKKCVTEKKMTLMGKLTSDVKTNVTLVMQNVKPRASGEPGGAVSRIIADQGTCNALCSEYHKTEALYCCWHPVRA